MCALNLARRRRQRGLCPWSVSPLLPRLPVVSLAKYHVTSGTLPPSLSLCSMEMGSFTPGLAVGDSEEVLREVFRANKLLLHREGST